MNRRCTLFLIMGLLFSGVGVCGADEALVRIDRTGGEERNLLLERGVTLVAELDASFLALGDAGILAAETGEMGLSMEVLDEPSIGREYVLAGFGRGPAPDDLSSCGEVVFADDVWAVLRADEGIPMLCRERTDLWLQKLSRKAIRPTRDAPDQWRDFQSSRSVLTVDPLVEGMVAGLTDDLAMQHWQGIVDLAPTRYSTAAGCDTAATGVGDIFASVGLQVEYQNHTSNHAPNVIGTKPGTDLGSEVVILIGHLDDLPSSGLAPGADDNASGSAMVTALAEVMSCTNYRRTVKFLTVTGEEFGLYGSDYYAAEAASQGEQITAVLNGDMIGWEGDGYPAVEDLDINQNTASEWLGNLFAQAAEDYETGSVVNNFTCNSMAYSDHWPFWQEGYPALCGITDNFGFCGQGGENYDYPHYHQSSDTIANNGPNAPAFIGGAMRTYLATAALLAEPVSAVVSAVGDVSATADGDRRIVVSWNAPQPGMSFEVRRLPGGCTDPGPATVLGSTFDTSFADETASGGVTYGYEVRATEGGGPCASAWSECVEAVTTGDCTEPPFFEGVAAAVNQETAACGVELSWAPARLWCGDVATYAVYRSTEPDFEPGSENLVAAAVSGSPWLDTGAMTPGVTNYWIVQATDQSVGLSDGNTVRKAARPTGPVTMGTWLDDAEAPGEGFLELESPWQILVGEGVSGSDAYGTDNYPSNMCSAAVSPALTLGNDAELVFWSRYDIEEDWDKGEVQISTDGGGSWTRLEVDYPMQATFDSSDACGLPRFEDYFTGSGSTWSPYSASLATWAGQEIRVRWVLSSDGYVEGSGWWIDDLSISPAGVPGMCVPGVGGIFADGFELGDLSRWSDVVPAL